MFDLGIIMKGEIRGQRGQRVNSSQHRFVPWTELVHADLLSLREPS